MTNARRYPWIKVQRCTMNHQWLNDRPEWFMAWMHMLMSADHATGEVNLSEVPAREHFSRDGWLYFLEALKREDMICNLERRGVPGKRGSVAFCTIKKWFEYQGVAKPDEVPDEKPDIISPSQTAKVSHQPDEKPDGFSDEFENTPYISLREREEAAASKFETEANSSEARAHAVMTGRPNPIHEKLKAQHFFAQLIGWDNLKHPQMSEGDAFVSYYRTHGEERLRDFWAEALQQRDKPPRFHFFDLCKGAALPRIIHDKPRAAKRFEEDQTVVYVGDRYPGIKGQRLCITNIGDAWITLEYAYEVKPDEIKELAA